MRDGDLTSKDAAKLGDITKLQDREWAPCRYGCPVHADVRLYIEHAAAGRFLEAIDVIRKNLPFASVCGRICHHPCEANCRREEVDAAVAIREVKRFVAETIGTKATVNKAAKQDKARIAIVGAGPAGMAAALELAKKGYRPTVFEKFPIAGGIPVTAIPKYRLPKEILQIDIDWICAHGVELVTGVEIGKDKTLDDLKKDGFEAVLVAAGLAKSRMLPLPGADAPGVYPVLDFLTKLAFDEPVTVGDDVLVIGGGNVAVDAARSAVRCGAKRVRMMMLEDEQEMPAWDWEQEEAKEEGVSFIHRRGPVEIKTDGEKITAVVARKVTQVFDEDKKFSPQYDDADIIDIECDTVILAIGQMADTGFVEGSEVKLDERGRLTFNPATHQTNVPNVFACGEIVTPPGSAVEACASGQRAADAIDQYLTSGTITLDDTLPPHIDEIPAETGEKVRKAERVKVTFQRPEQRKHNRDEMDHTLSADQAACEARRCMSCGSGAEVLVDKCAACMTCLRVCPFDIPKVTDVARIDSVMCQACGICIAECPANAIIWRSRPMDTLDKQIAAALSSDKKTLALVCGHKATAADWQGASAAAPDGVAELYLPSMARVSTTALLHAVENGAKKVLVIAAADNAERYPEATGRIRARVEQAQELLKEIGMPAETIQLLTVAGEGRDAIVAAEQAAVAE